LAATLVNTSGFPDVLATSFTRRPSCNDRSPLVIPAGDTVRFQIPFRIPASDRVRNDLSAGDQSCAPREPGARDVDRAEGHPRNSEPVLYKGRRWFSLSTPGLPPGEYAFHCTAHYALSEVGRNPVKASAKGVASWSSSVKQATPAT
jgi:hypothetical protein